MLDRLKISIKETKISYITNIKHRFQQVCFPHKGHNTLNKGDLIWVNQILL